MEDLVRRRRWVRFDASADLRSEITGKPLQVASPAQIAASHVDEWKRTEETLSVMASLLEKVFSKRSIFDSFSALSLFGWNAVAKEHEDAYNAQLCTLSRADIHQGVDAERVRGILYALPYAKAAYGDAMLKGHIMSVEGAIKAKALHGPRFD